MKKTVQKKSAKKLRVGIVCYPTVGGSGIVATGLGTQLASLGHQVHFISYEAPFKLDTKQKNVFFHKVQFNEYELFKYPDYTLPLAVTMVNVAHTYKLDIMHVHYAVPHATAALLAKDIATKERLHFPNIVTTLHGTDITLLARDKTVMPVIKYSIETSCGVTAVSESLKKDTEKVLTDARHIKVIHNFYDPLKVTKSARRMRTALGVQADDFLIIHLSNLRPVKRITDLLTIISKLKKYPNVKLLILSGGDFTPYRALAKRLGIENKLIIKNSVQDIQNYINAADIGLYTSSEESFGMGILETMSYGKPVLATNIGGIPEFMDHGETGYLYRVGETSLFAQKIIKLMKDPSLVQKLGTTAQERAREAFSSAKIVEEYLEYYRQIIKTCP